MSFKGGGGVPFRPAAAAAHKWVGRPPSTVIFSNAPGPVFQVGDFHGRVWGGVEVSFEDLSIEGTTIGVHIQAASGITFRNVGVSASVWLPDDGSEARRDNAAMVVSDTFWLWCTACTFRNPTPPPPAPPAKIVKSDRPSVILRGTIPKNTSLHPSVDQTYLIRFDSAGFWGGGVQYQQLCEHGLPSVGYWQFLNVAQEDSWTPLIDLVSDPALAHVGTFEHITVIGYMDADTKGGSRPVVRFNMSQPDARLDGVTIIGAGDTRVAVQMVNGTLGSAVVLNGHASGAQQVEDGSGKTVGSALLKTPGGVALIGLPSAARHRSADSATLHDAGGSEHALLVGESGAASARLAIDADGSLKFGDGAAAEFDTVLERFTAATVPWGPLALPAADGGLEAALNVTVAGAAPGDTASAALTTVGDSPVTLTAAVAAAGRVVVVCALRSTAPSFQQQRGGAAIPAGVLRVVVSKFR